MPELVAEAVSLSDIGRRDRQEDAVIADFPQGSEFGLAVLSDGMGGHNDGDLASRILVSEMFGELYFSGARLQALAKNIPHVFQSALHVANKRLQRHTKTGALSKDTGGTLVSIALLNDRLNWISVGDSPLYLYRKGHLQRLNENHSLAPQIDLMAQQGLMDATTARDHPQRGCLTSAVTGNEIARIDCPNAGFDLRAGDIVLLASDGINVLDDTEIARRLWRLRRKGPQEMAQDLLAHALGKDAPDQDNLALVVIKMSPAKSARQQTPATSSRLARALMGWLAGPTTERVNS